jgi:hypothetical protein
MPTSQRNEGEGNRTAARQYNKATTEFAKSGKVQTAADKAKRSLSSPKEAADMKRAEAAGRAPAKRKTTASKANVKARKAH